MAHRPAAGRARLRGSGHRTRATHSTHHYLHSAGREHPKRHRANVRHSREQHPCGERSHQQHRPASRRQPHHSRSANSTHNVERNQPQCNILQHNEIPICQVSTINQASKSITINQASRILPNIDGKSASAFRPSTRKRKQLRHAERTHRTTATAMNTLTAKFSAPGTSFVSKTSPPGETATLLSQRRTRSTSSPARRSPTSRSTASPASPPRTFQPTSLRQIICRSPAAR